MGAPHQLTVDDVRYIRRRVAAGQSTQAQLARQHGVTIQAINAVVRGRVYKWVAP